MGIGENGRQMDPSALNSVTTDGALVSALMHLFSDAPEKRKFILQDCIKFDKNKSPKAQSRIGVYDQLSIIANTTKLLGPQWPLNTPIFWKKALDNVFCTAVRTAPTIDEAINFIWTYGFLWSPVIIYESFPGPKNKIVTVDVINPDGLKPHLVTGLETLRNLAILAPYIILNETIKGDWKDVQLSMGLAESDIKPYRTFFDLKVTADGQRHSIQLPAKLLQKKCKNADPAKFRKANLQIQHFLHPPERDRSLERDVRAYIDATLFHRPSVGEVAKSVGMSTRTLNRRLEKTGVSFREILEKSLQSRTQLLLTQGLLSRGEIAERLGYKDQASFSRALKRWKTE